MVAVINLKSTIILSILSTALLIVMLLGIGVNVNAAPGGQAGDGLFADSATVESSGDLPDDPTIIRSRFVEPKFELLGGTDDTRSSAGVLVLNLFDDVTFTAMLETAESNPSGSLSWMGHLVGVEHGSVVLVVKNEVMVGSVNMPGAFYRVSYVGDGVHAISEMNSAAFPPELEPIPVTPSDDELAEALIAPMADDGSTIDVLVVYTAAARGSVGGTPAMETMIDLAVTETNQSYASSGITQRLNLVHTAEVTYDESGFDWETTLHRLRNTSDTYMDNVHTLRDCYSADEVVLIVAGAPPYAGIAYLMTSVSTSFASWAFSVVSSSWATGYYTFAHELGHNMAAHHDWYVNNSTIPYTYNHGYVNSTGRWLTIMAYHTECSDQSFYCTRLGYWSNPNVLYGSDPMGVPAGTSKSCNMGVPNPNCDADNHLVLNNTAYTVANFRSSSDIPPSPPNNIEASDGTYADKVRITWDSSSGATGYEVYQATSPTGSKTSLGNTSSSPFDDTTATAGTTYYYWVEACNTYGCSACSDHDTGWRNYVPPGNVQATDGVYTDKVRISWNSSPGAGSYKLYRALSAGGSKSYLGPDTASPFDDTTAVTGLTYYYWVTACNGDASRCSAYSGYNTGYRAGSAPSAPTNIQASDGTYADKVRITWDSSSGATGYEVYQAASPSGGKTSLGNASSSLFDDITATAGTTYYYWVEACNTYGCSTDSDYDAGWRNYLPPDNVQATDGTYTDKVRISWNSSPGAGSYKLYRALSSGGSKSYLGPDTASPFDDTTASTGTIYYYWVTACGSDASTCSDYGDHNTGYRAYEMYLPVILKDNTS